MRYIVCLFLVLLKINAEETINQAPLIVEFQVFKEALRECRGSDYTRLPCLINILKNYNNKIYTKYSGSSAKISVLFYAMDSNGRITTPKNINSKYCEFKDTMGKTKISKLSGNGYHYVLDYVFEYSSSFTKAYIACYGIENKKENENNGRVISQITQPISVIPKDFDINLGILSKEDSIQGLNTQNEVALTLKTQKYPLNINRDATARTINGNVDIGFSDYLYPLQIIFSRDNGACNAIGESIEGNLYFKNGSYKSNQINIGFLDVADGELEISLGNNLDRDDRASGKCLLNIPDKVDITNVGKIPCQKPITIKKRVSIVPYNFYIQLENNGKQIYYGQHEFIPSIPYLPNAKLNIQAINDRNQIIKNFTNNCWAKDINIQIDDGKNDLIFINDNTPDSKVSKNNFINNSQANIERKLSSRGIKDRYLSPLDALSSNIIDLNQTKLIIRFSSENNTYPIYSIKPKISNDWRIALLRGRIYLAENTNESTSLVANPKINYELYCKSPICNIVDIESVISPYARFQKSLSGDNWYINSNHPSNFKVEENNLILPENISVFSIGNVVNGVQTIALKSTMKGIFNIKINQNGEENSFATFLYFSPIYNNSNLGVESKVRF